MLNLSRWSFGRSSLHPKEAQNASSRLVALHGGCTPLRGESIAISVKVDCRQPSRSEKHHAACRWQPVKTVHQVQIHVDQWFCESQHNATQCLGRAKCSTHFVIPKHRPRLASLCCCSTVLSSHLLCCHHSATAHSKLIVMSVSSSSAMTPW